MQQSLAYIKNTALLLVGLLTLFIAVGAILVVLGMATWTDLADWSLKALAVAAILFVLNGVISLIISTTRRS